MRAALMPIVIVAAGVSTVDRVASQDQAKPFRVIFASGSTDVLTSGDAGKNSSAAISALAQLLPSWTPAQSAAIIFVAPKSSGSDQLLWQRTRTVLSAARKAAPGRNWPLQAEPRQNFIENVAPSVKLMPVSTDQAAIDIRLFQDERQLSAERCPWRVTVRDATLPPVLTPSGASETFTIVNQGTLPVTRLGELKIIGPSKKFRAVWEMERGDYCTTVIDPTGQLMIPAETPVRLHVTAIENSLAEVRDMLLAPDCATLRDTRTLASNSRGIGDNARLTPQGSVQPNPANSICAFGVAALSLQ